MKKHSIKVEKTARYFTLGKLTPKTKRIFFVLHGYAQTAETFIKDLDFLEDDDTYIIAPEGLSRFYWKNFTSNPVASWMTKLERLDDINDNIEYLDKLYHKITLNVKIKNIEINYIGFSQGAGTLSRWLYFDRIKVNNVFFYAGDFAEELNYSISENYNNSNMYYIYGINDFFISKEKIEKIKEKFSNIKLNLNIFTFEGKHEIHTKALNFITKKTKK